MAKRRKGVVPAHLRPYLFKRKASRGGATVAYKRKAKRASTVRRYARKAHSIATGGPVSLLSMAFSFGYGYGRQYITNNSMFQTMKGWLGNVAGAYTDNFILGGLAYGLAWLFRPTNAYIKEALATVVRSEAFLAGQTAAAGGALTSSQGAPQGVTLN